MPNIQVIGIIGAGTMGRGIAHVAARAGLNVTLADIDPATLERAKPMISRNMEHEIRKGLHTEAGTAEALERIETTSDPRDLRRAQFLIEAVREDLETKLEVLSSLDEILEPDVILASNTSSLSVTRLAAATDRPQSVVGMHFMNPVPLMPLVEIVRGLETSDSTLATTDALAGKLGKTPVVVSDSPGFVSNRLLMPMINEAAICLMEGIGNRESIDRIMELGMNHPMGPLALADLIGLDVCLNVMEVLHAGLGESKYRPCPLLRRMVDAGHLGRKTGRGFYTY